AGGDSTAAAPSVYLQVSSSQNPAWANELGDKLKAAGLPASVLAPARSDEAYRVVLGPYATREQAEEAGKKIGMPSFVVTPQDNPERYPDEAHAARAVRLQIVRGYRQPHVRAGRHGDRRSQRMREVERLRCRSLGAG